MEDYVAVGSNILIELPEKKEKTDSGLFLPEGVQQNQNTHFGGSNEWGTVLKVGEKVNTVSVGDKILLVGSMGLLPLDGKEYGMMRVENVTLIKKSK